MADKTWRGLLAAALVSALLAHPARAEMPLKPMIEVEFEFAGAALDIVAERLTPLIENNLGAAPGLSFMVSLSRAGRSRLVLKFKTGVGESAALARVREHAAAATRRLPLGSPGPAIRALGPARRPLALVGYVSQRMLQGDVSSYLEGRVRQSLQAVPGVAAVRVYGARQEIGLIRLDRSRLAALNIGIDTIRTALREMGIDVAPSVSVDREPALTFAPQRDLESIGDVVVAVVSGTPVRLRDIAGI